MATGEEQGLATEKNLHGGENEAMKGTFHRPLNLLVMLGGGSSAALGLLVLVGWFIHNVSLIQVLPAFAPMPYNAALGFLIGGLGLVTVVYSKPRLTVACAAMIGILGFLTLIEYLLGNDLGVDEFLMRDYIQVETAHPGRMAPNTALCFVLLGAALMVKSWFGWLRHCALLLGLLASIIVALGVVAFAGYVSGLETAYGWGYVTRMAVHTATGFILLGAAVFALAWAEETGAWRTLPRWLVFPVGISSVTASLLLWQAALVQERIQIQTVIEGEANKLGTAIKELIEPEILALVRMSLRWEIRGGTPRKEWEADGTYYLAQLPGLQTIEWVDPSFDAGWIVPLEGNETALNPDLSVQERRRTELEKARDRREVMVSPTIELAQGDKGFRVLIPLFSDNDFGGFILGVFSVSELLDRPVSKEVGLEYSWTIFEGEEEIHSHDSTNREHEERWGQETTIEFYGISWRLRIWPGSELLGAKGSSLPEVSLVAGLLMTSLLTVVVQLGQKALRRAKAAESARRELEKEVSYRKQAETQFRGLLESAPDALVIADQSGKIVLINSQTEKLFGYSGEELSGQAVEMLMPEGSRSKHLEHRAGYDAHPEIRQMGANLELYGRSKDGSNFPVEISLSPLKTEEGILVTTAIRDITKRKQTEEAMERYAEELARSNAELEQFAYVASHDLQEPLRMVVSYLQLLKKRYRDKLDTDAEEFIEFAVDGATRMRKLTDDLLEYSRVGTRGKEFKPTDLEAVFDDAVANLKSQIEENGTVLTHEPLPTVMVDDIQLTQLYQNLIGNAIKFRSDRPPEIHVEAERKDGEWLFSVEDNGIGIDSKHAERIFVLFQRLHGRREYTGTGMGLAICKKIVERQGGRIWVESEPGKGSTFYFTIPDSGGE